MTETARDGDLCSADCSQAAGNLAPVASGEGGLSVAANGCLVTEISASDPQRRCLELCAAERAGRCIDRFYDRPFELLSECVAGWYSDDRGLGQRWGALDHCQSLGKCAGRVNR